VFHELVSIPVSLSGKNERLDVCQIEEVGGAENLR
jgi:hypothetical protein